MSRRSTTLALLTCLVACSDPAAPTQRPAGAPASSAAIIDQSANPLDVAVIGDVPYGSDALAQFPTLVGAINADPKVRLVVHVGDIKSGSTECSTAWFQEIAHQFSTFADPLVYAIGDNEWTDCHRANNGGYDPLGRLAVLRDLFFADPGHTLGGRNMRTEAQASYPENQLWVESRVTFAALHVVGSNNGLEPWFGGAETPAQTAAREAEVAARNAANLAWLEHAFATAREQGSVGIALFFQADLWHPEDRAAGAHFSAHAPFVGRLAQLAAAYGKPVLLVVGDSHDLRVDTGVPWFSLYGVTPPANVTQVVVDRSIETDIDWLRLHVDPRSAEVFTWTQVLVP
jgi:hypothetical protein